MREDVRREAERVAKRQEEHRRRVKKAREELDKERQACREETEGVAALGRQLEEALVTAKAARDGLERERGKMLQGFLEVRSALEVRLSPRIRARLSV